MYASNLFEPAGFINEFANNCKIFTVYVHIFITTYLYISSQAYKGNLINCLEY